MAVVSKFANTLYSNQTNLALKGIIGIEAMAVIANMTGHAADGANYTNIAHSYIKKWQNLGIAHDANPPHTTLAYGMNDTHGKFYWRERNSSEYTLRSVSLKACYTISTVIGNLA